MWRLLVLTLIASASAQIPALGWCPDYQPMANFSIKDFLGTWYEAERYFTVSELGSRCVTTKYESTPDGVILVSNEITSTLTGMKRVLEGLLQTVGREGEGRIVVKYTTLPVPYENIYSILDTDYKNYAVMWSCSGIGPVHTQNAWVLTRERTPTTATMQAAYGVLDKFKITRAFFIKTNQADCNLLPNPVTSAAASKDAEIKESPKNKTEGELHGLDLLMQYINESTSNFKPKLEIPQERTAKPESPKEEKKPLQAPEINMTVSSSERKEEKIDKPEEPLKAEKPDILESESKGKKEEKPAQ